MNNLMAEVRIVITCFLLKFSIIMLNSACGEKRKWICKQTIQIHEVKLKSRWEMYDYFHKHVNEVPRSHVTQILFPSTFVPPQL